MAQVLGRRRRGPRGSAAAARAVGGRASLDVAALARPSRPTVVPGPTGGSPGVPRADRLARAAGRAVEDVLRLARQVVDHVVVDTGFSVEDDEELSYDTAAPRRNATTLAALEAADRLVVVGAGDPVGLQRLVRAVQEVAVIPSPPPVVVVNKTRSSSAGPRPERTISAVLERFAGLESVRFLPWSPEECDEAVLAERLGVEIVKSNARAGTGIEAVQAFLSRAAVRAPVEVERTLTNVPRGTALPMMDAFTERRRRVRAIVEAAGFVPPDNRHGQSVRTWVRSLEAIQKEALVTSALSGLSWRFASDEGPHLQGRDQAPNPLSYLSVGMVAGFMNEIMALAAQRGVSLSDVELVLENFYYRAGSFPRGTMVSGALPPELTLTCEANCDERVMGQLLHDAVCAVPLHGLMTGAHNSLVHHHPQRPRADAERCDAACGRPAGRSGRLLRRACGRQRAARAPAARRENRLGRGDLAADEARAAGRSAVAGRPAPSSSAQPLPAVAERREGNRARAICRTEPDLALPLGRSTRPRR